MLNPSRFVLLGCSMVHRCGEGILKVDLPPKLEVVLKLSLTPTQDHVYRRYLQVPVALSY
jgi:hypothetical protein